MVEEKDKERILKISKNENIRIILTDFKDNFLKKHAHGYDFVIKINEIIIYGIKSCICNLILF